MDTVLTKRKVHNQYADEEVLDCPGLPDQLITFHGKTSSFCWAGVIANGSGGPFPLGDVLLKYLLKRTGLSRDFPGDDFDTAFSNIFSSRSCPRLQFLYNALARHCSWSCVPVRPFTHEHLLLFQDFFRRSIHFATSMTNRQRDANFAGLLDLERKLARVSFKAWPDLFDDVLNRNTCLVNEIDKKFPDFSRFDRIPNLREELNPPHWERDLNNLIKHAISVIMSQWIYLEAQIEILQPTDRQLAKYKGLQLKVAKQWVKACNAANDTIIKMVNRNQTVKPGSPQPPRGTDYEFDLLENDWTDVEPFLKNIGELDRVRRREEKCWEDLKTQKAKHLEIARERRRQEQDSMEEDEDSHPTDGSDTDKDTSSKEGSDTDKGANSKDGSNMGEGVNEVNSNVDENVKDVAVASDENVFEVDLNTDINDVAVNTDEDVKKVDGSDVVEEKHYPPADYNMVVDFGPTDSPNVGNDVRPTDSPDMEKDVYPSPPSTGKKDSP